MGGHQWQQNLRSLSEALAKYFTFINPPLGPYTRQIIPKHAANVSATENNLFYP